MGGTATAAPLDAIGALFWNPATLSGLKSSELSIGAEALFPHPRVESSVRANAFGPGVPPISLAGSTQSDNAGAVLPDVGLAYRPCDSAVTYGLGLLTAGAFSTNYPASRTNPILTPQAPNGIGFGNISADFQVLQVAPAISVQLTDHLSVGGGPMLDLSALHADPLILVAPDANGQYPNGQHSPFHFGAGVQAGAYLTTDSGWNFGASLKSPQWFERFRVNAVDERGFPRRESVRFDLPLIASLGVSYGGIDRMLIASDVRYIDYRNTAPFDRTGFAPTGAVRGVGWDSVFVVTAGVQYLMTDRLSLRMGYSYNNDPQNGDVAIFNVAAPVILEHVAYTGLSFHFTQNLIASLAYIHGFENSIEGPYMTPQGPVPGTSVKNIVSADAFSLGITVRF